MLGFHVEVMGGGKATRRDIEELMRAFPLRALVLGRCVP